MKKTTRVAIVGAAQRLFSTVGYDGASMESIASEAGVTKMTVYRHFDNKEALFSAALQAFFDQLPPAASIVPESRGPLRHRLLVAATGLLALGTGPLMVRLHRMLSLPMESAHGTAEQLWEANFQSYHDAVQQLLKAEREAGTLELPDTRVAATHLLSLIAGEPMVRLFLTGSAFREKADADTHAQAAVDMFMRAYASRQYTKPSRPSKQ